MPATSQIKTNLSRRKANLSVLHDETITILSVCKFVYMTPSPISSISTVNIKPHSEIEMKLLGNAMNENIHHIQNNK